MFSQELFQIEYQTDTTNITLNKRNFSFFTPKAIDRFVDPDDVFNDFPLWSKIWEASIVLAEYLSATDADPNKRLLEIGGGMGIAGIIAASFGHNVTMTEYNTDALNFAHANAEKNLDPAETNFEILKLDWNDPNISGSFDIIFGSEIIYNDKNHQPILDLFRTFLKPGGEIILAERARKTSIQFFSQISDLFDIRAQKKILRSNEDEIMVMLCRLRYR